MLDVGNGSSMPAASEGFDEVEPTRAELIDRIIQAAMYRCMPLAL